jgi:hypothetical protein
VDALIAEAMGEIDDAKREQILIRASAWRWRTWR